jgi:UDP-N-acetylglucosamine:LPS N-acetylglucosamine transferase
MPNKKDLFTIAIAAELAPAKTLIPVIEKLLFLEDQGNLNWKHTKIIGLYHGSSSKKLLESISEECYYIGQGRGSNQKKNSNLKLFSLIFRDFFRAFNAMKGKNIDLLITCGNAGDVRKSILAANFLNIPVLHIEQDIYNPIELISHANLVTVPSEKYVSYLMDNYGLKNVVNIAGYPMVSYVYDSIESNQLISKQTILDEYGFVDDYLLLVLGGDLRDDELGNLIKVIEDLDINTLIAPYRFDKSFVKDLVVSSKVIVLDNYVNLFDYMNSAKFLIYAAGMGMTIEAGVFGIPSIKIEGFHKVHGSVDLANDLNIPVVPISKISFVIKDLHSPCSGNLLKNSEIAIDNLVYIINNFDTSLSKSGLNSTKKIWNKRKIFR